MRDIDLRAFLPTPSSRCFSVACQMKLKAAGMSASATSSNAQGMRAVGMPALVRMSRIQTSRPRSHKKPAIWGSSAGCANVVPLALYPGMSRIGGRVDAAAGNA